ncbi:MAG: elongator complex protein 3 [Candidatus Saccharibacteria bacterium]
MKKHAIIPIFVPHFGCSYTCVFCNQKSITGHQHKLDPAAISYVIEEHLATMPDELVPELAFFGGSFTAIPEEEQIAYLQVVQPYIKNGSISQIRISTRPDVIYKENLRLLYDHGVCVIELGVQSLDPEVLRASGRPYNPEIVGISSSLIKDMGFILGHQVMVGLPKSSLAKEIATARKIAEIGPDILRIYPTVVIRETPLALMFQRGEYQPLTLEQAVEACALLLTIYAKAGINIIRIGLQPSEELLAGSELIAGPFHPSFGELVESEVFRRQAALAIAGFTKGGTAEDLRLYVNRRDLSKMIGHGRCNIRSLKNMFGLANIKTTGLDGLVLNAVGVGYINSDSPQLVLSRQDYCDLCEHQVMI